MNNKTRSDFERVAAAIRFIDEHRLSQPSLEEVARAMSLSPYHCQRLFRRWAGISPKRFLQFATVGNAKRLLSDSTALDTAYALGLSSPSRLHEHFVNIEAMSPGEYKGRGKGLTISYGEYPSPFGTVLIAATPRGICHIGFVDDGAQADPLGYIRQTWPHARLQIDNRVANKLGRAIFGKDRGADAQFNLLVKGTNFQVKVWEALLRIPAGCTASYQQLAQAVGSPRGHRAVANAVAHNPIAYLIPCHRVIRATGAFGGYRWGVVRKRTLLATEMAQHSPPI